MSAGMRVVDFLARALAVGRPHLWGKQPRDDVSLVGVLQGHGASGCTRNLDQPHDGTAALTRVRLLTAVRATGVVFPVELSGAQRKNAHVRSSGKHARRVHDHPRP